MPPTETNEKERRNPLFRQIEILKLLQGRKMRTTEIAEHFKPKCDDSFIRTIQRDLVALRDGIEVFGSTIKIEESTEGHSVKYYKSTIHPIFLGLNLTELFALLKLLEDHREEPTYRGIFDSVYNQITDYAEEQLAPRLKQKYAKKPGSIINSLDEKQYKGNILYLWKSGRVVDITYTTKEGKTITRPCRVINYDDRKKEVSFLDAERKECRPLGEIEIPWDEIPYQ